MKDEASIRQRILETAKALNAELRSDWQKVWIDDIRCMLWVLE